MPAHQMEKLKNKIIFVCLILLAIFIWTSWTTASRLQEYKNEVVKFKDGEQVFTEQINQQGELIAEQTQVILTQKDAIAHNLLEIDNLKKVKSQVKIRTVTKIDSVFVPIIDTIERVIYDTSGVAMLRLPTSFGLDTEWYSINTTVEKRGLLIDSLKINNRQLITLGLKSNGLFKSPTPTVIIKNENPYVSVSSLNNVVIKNDSRFYDKKGFWLGVGFIGGILTPVLINNGN